jgi:hypothetical protein
MIEIMAESSGNIIGIRAIGTLTDADYKEMLMPRLERLFAQYRKLRVLFYMGEKEFAGWTVSAAWDDARLGLRYRSDFEKIAVVGGPRWVEWSSKFATFLITGEIRTFPADRVQDAWDWVKAA